jgi:hypothetical protein
MEIFGYDIITKKEFEKLCENENNELNELYNKEQFNMYDVESKIDYDLHNIIEKTDDDIIYEKTDMNLSYLDWLSREDYVDGMNWFKKYYSDIPFIEHISYFYVKKAITGSTKLEKYERNIIKKELKKDEKYYDNIEAERNKYIRKLKKEKNKPLKTMKYENKKVIVKF